MSAVRYFDLEQILCLRDCVTIGAPSKDPARFVDWDFGFRILRNKEAQEYSRVPKKQTTTSGSQLGGGEDQSSRSIFDAATPST